MGVRTQRGFAVDQVGLWIQAVSAQGLAGDHPVQSVPRVVAGDAGGVGAGAHGNAHVQHALDRRRALGGLLPITRHEVLALVSHAVLNGHAAAEPRNALKALVADRFRMVKEPVQAVERNVAVDLFEHVQGPRDGLVVRGVQAERPPVCNQQAHHGFHVGLHGGRHLRTRLLEVLEVGGGKDQHLAGAVVAVEVVTLLRLDHAGPAREVREFFLGLLREQVVGDAHGQLMALVQVFDHLVVVGIVLEPTTGVDYAGQTQAIEFTHEMACRVQLVLAGQLRALGQRRIQHEGIGLGQQQAGGFAARVFDDQAAGRIGRVLGVAGRPQRSTVEQGTVVEMHDEHRRVGRHGIDLVERRQALLGELLISEATDHAHPLRRRGARDLLFQAPHRIGERGDAVPAQLHVVVEPAADDVDVRVDQARNHAARRGVDDTGVGADQGHHFSGIAHGDEAPARHRHGTGQRALFVQGGDLGVMDDQIGSGHGSSSRRSGEGSASCRGGKAAPGLDD